MGKYFTCLFAFAVISLSSAAFAADFFHGSIAVEHQEEGKFTGIIGKAWLTEQAIEIVTFAQNDSGGIVPFAFIEIILEKKNDAEGVFNVKCRNQLGIISTGTIDLRDGLNPKIFLKTDTGIILTNISNAGREMKNKFLPSVDLGR